jgi:hypothetical protein
MSLPPEVLFHRYFQTLAGSDRATYRGKEDLTHLQPPEFQSLLGALQEALNEGLRDIPQIPKHKNHALLHVDYIDSNVPNALAFSHEGYSFIGITIPLIDILWDVCAKLSESEEIVAVLGVHPVEGHDALRVVLFRTLLFFVVMHEWTHHVHGHVCPPSSESIFYSEILEGNQPGGLEDQAREADADAYAAYYVLGGLITGVTRTPAIGLLNLGAEPASIQDEVLFSSFVVAVGAYLFVRPTPALDKASIYKLTHPPQAARMNCLMNQALRWCSKNRPALEAWMTPEQFQMLMSIVARAAVEISGSSSWKAQAEFLQSKDGIEYLGRLDDSVKAHIQSL